MRYEQSIVRAQDFADDLSKQYEMLRLQGKEHSLRPFVEYLALRQDFLLPCFLVPLRESFRRADFNFAHYLTLCLAQSVGKFFTTRIFTLFLALPLVLGSFFLLHWAPEKAVVVLALALPLTCLILTQISLSHLRGVYTQLMPSAPAQSSYLRLELDASDPFDLHDRVGRPDFLGHHNDDERNSESEFGSQAAAPVRTPPARRCCRSNRHQALFCCGRSGPSFILALQQILYLVTLAWATWFTLQAVRALALQTDLVVAIVSGLMALLLLLFLFLQMPAWLEAFTLATSLQMMKRRPQEEAVIRDTKLQIAQRALRVAQTFSIIRGELQPSEANQHARLRGISRRLLWEVFQLFPRAPRPHDPYSLNAKQCQELVRLCGARLTQREQFVLLKKAGASERISFAQLLEALEAFHSPENTLDNVTQVLRLHCRTSEIRLHHLAAFFREFETYFENQDISEFLEEIKLLLREKIASSLSPQEVAARLRNDLRFLPR